MIIVPHFSYFTDQASGNQQIWLGDNLDNGSATLRQICRSGCADQLAANHYQLIFGDQCSAGGLKNRLIRRADHMIQHYTV